MDETSWNTCRDPKRMIQHLEERGCAGDFLQLEKELTNRIRSEITEPALLEFIEQQFTQDSQEKAQDRIADLSEAMAELETCDPKFAKLNRQIEIANAILVFDGQGYAETVADLAEGIACLFDDTDSENAWQADTIRRIFPYNYSNSHT